jgi:3-oxoacyl-[acyl-carrier protein] reductase
MSEKAGRTRPADLARIPASGFDGRVAIVTGASGAIGGAVARALAAAGARVVGTYLSGETRARQLRRDGGGAIEIQRADVTSERDSRKLVEGTLSRHRRLDILVNAATAPPPASSDLAELRAAEMDHAYRVAVMGTFLCCRAAAPEMREHGSGAIVNVVCSEALRADPLALAAAAAASAVTGLTRTLSRQLAPHVRVNALAAGREGSRGGISAAALYLASDAASAITGQTVDLGGAPPPP